MKSANIGSARMIPIGDGLPDADLVEVSAEDGRPSSSEEKRYSRKNYDPEYHKGKKRLSHPEDGLTCIKTDKPLADTAKHASLNLAVCSGCERMEDVHPRTPPVNGLDILECPVCGGNVSVRCGSKLTGEDGRRCNRPRKTGQNRCSRHQGRPKSNIKRISGSLGRLLDEQRRQIEAGGDPLSCQTEIAMIRALASRMILEDHETESGVDTKSFCELMGKLAALQASEMKAQEFRGETYSLVEVIALLRSFVSSFHRVMDQYSASAIALHGEECFEDSMNSLLMEVKKELSSEVSSMLSVPGSPVDAYLVISENECMEDEHDTE